MSATLLLLLWTAASSGVTAITIPNPKTQALRIAQTNAPTTAYVAAEPVSIAPVTQPPATDPPVQPITQPPNPPPPVTQPPVTVSEPPISPVVVASVAANDQTPTTATPKPRASQFAGYEHLSPNKKLLADSIMVVYDWVRSQHPVATTLLQIGKQMSDTQIDQIPGARALFEVIGEALDVQDVKEWLDKYNVTGDQHKNSNAMEVSIDIIDKYNLSLSDIPLDKLTGLAEYANKIPGVSSLIQTAMNHQANGIPFAMTMIQILSPVITEIPVTQWNNLTVIGETAAKAYHHLKPYVTPDIPRIPGYLVDQGHNVLLDAINATFRWADTNFPVAVHVLQVAKQMSDTQLSHIAGADAFLHIVSEALRFHTIKERMKKDNMFGDKYRNLTMDKVLLDIITKYNISLSDVPIDKLTKLGSSIQNIPGVKQLADFALHGEVEGVPFLMTMVSLLGPMLTDTPLSHVTNHTVLTNLGKKAVSEIGPYVVKAGNNTLDSLHHSAKYSISNLTELSKNFVNKLADINRNLANLTLSGAQGLATNLHNLTHNTLERASELNEEIEKFGHDSVANVKHNVADIWQSTRKLISDPLSVPTGVGRAVGNITLDSLGRMMTFTKWVGNLTWSHLYEMGAIGDKARKFSVHSVKQVTHLGKDVVYHTYSTIRNLSSITANMSPIQMLTFSSVEDLVRSQVKTGREIFSNMPVISDLPGVGIVKTLVDKFPQIEDLGFNQLMDFLDKFRTKHDSNN